MSTNLRVGVDLVDGTVMELHEAAPGFDLFLDRAATVLPGLQPFAAWSPGLEGATVETVIYERKELGKRSR